MDIPRNVLCSNRSSFSCPVSRWILITTCKYDDIGISRHWLHTDNLADCYTCGGGIGFSHFSILVVVSLVKLCVQLRRIHCSSLFPGHTRQSLWQMSCHYSSNRNFTIGNAIGILFPVITRLRIVAEFQFLDQDTMEFTLHMYANLQWYWSSRICGVRAGRTDRQTNKQNYTQRTL